MNLLDNTLDRNFKIELISKEALFNWIRQHNDPVILSLLFGGDRLLCCDEIVGIFVGDELASVASISPEGEDYQGEPTIVGMYTSKKFRNKGLGSYALKAAIARCVERGFEQIRVDVLSSKAKKLIGKLEEEFKKHLKIVLLPSILDLLDQ